LGRVNPVLVFIGTARCLSLHTIRFRGGGRTFIIETHVIVEVERVLELEGAKSRLAETLICKIIRFSILKIENHELAGLTSRLSFVEREALVGLHHVGLPGTPALDPRHVRDQMLQVIEDTKRVLFGGRDKAE
jgi:hypothetical protein